MIGATERRLQKIEEALDPTAVMALWLHSVRQEYSGPYLAALQAKGIPAFCPRARAYFDNDEVRLMVACFAVLFGYYGEGRGQVHGSAGADLAHYVDACIIELGRRYSALQWHPPPGRSAAGFRRRYRGVARR